MPVAKKVEGYHAHLTPSTENALKNLPPFSYDQPDLEDKALPNLDCTSDKTFCHVKDSCENVAPKVKPVGF